ncbi:hypothetical protein [Sagittula salina]|uniref:Uncharacterized protein n=1 Tax=Sagittula salina TaxID=2820268 RepID=A0A940MQP5_9RHOB|nr:hypothetical protein [Sagittula salina]MBP0484065.1 hypothetical protein [Sagittula salina]
MRKTILALCLVCAAPAAFAQEALDKCAQTEAWFNLAVDSRKLGETEIAVRRTLRADMGRDAADQLVAFVYALPEEHLTHDVGALAREQCEGL